MTQTTRRRINFVDAFTRAEVTDAVEAFLLARGIVNEDTVKKVAAVIGRAYEGALDHFSTDGFRTDAFPVLFLDDVFWVIPDDTGRPRLRSMPADVLEEVAAAVGADAADGLLGVFTATID